MLKTWNSHGEELRFLLCENLGEAISEYAASAEEEAPELR